MVPDFQVLKTLASAFDDRAEGLENLAAFTRSR
jgi:hypothetical protein